MQVSANEELNKSISASDCQIEIYLWHENKALWNKNKQQLAFWKMCMLSGADKDYVPRPS